MATGTPHPNTGDTPNPRCGQPNVPAEAPRPDWTPCAPRRWKAPDIDVNVRRVLTLIDGKDEKILRTAEERAVWEAYAQDPARAPLLDLAPQGRARSKKKPSYDGDVDETSAASRAWRHGTRYVCGVTTASGSERFRRRRTASLRGRRGDDVAVRRALARQAAGGHALREQATGVPRARPSSRHTSVSVRGASRSARARVGSLVFRRGLELQRRVERGPRRRLAIGRGRGKRQFTMVGLLAVDLLVADHEVGSLVQRTPAHARARADDARSASRCPDGKHRAVGCSR
jgi:hypothetical protein